MRVFLLGDTVGHLHGGQQLPEGYYHLDRMLKPLVRPAARSPAAARVWTPAPSPRRPLVEGAHRSTLEELTDWTLWADKDPQLLSGRWEAWRNA